MKWLVMFASMVFCIYIIFSFFKKYMYILYLGHHDLFLLLKK